MKKFVRIRTVFIYGLAALAGALLLHTSQNVQQAEDELAVITADVNREKDSIQVLKTEWAYLNSPERLEKLAKQFLDLSPPDPHQIRTDGSDIPEKAAVPIPEEKPVVAQPVSLSAPASPPKKPPPQKTSPPAHQPKPAQNIITKEKTLDDLLKEIAGEGPQ